MRAWKARDVSGFRPTTLTTFWIAAEAHQVTVAWETNTFSPPRSTRSWTTAAGVGEAVPSPGDGSGDAGGLPEPVGVASGEATSEVGGVALGVGVVDAPGSGLELTVGTGDDPACWLRVKSEAS